MELAVTSQLSFVPVLLLEFTSKLSQGIGSKVLPSNPDPHLV
jgi:hypothetical protein